MLVTIDFETYFDSDYTLRKLSTSEYVRDERFEAISCAIKINNRATKVYFGEDIKSALAAIDWSAATLLAHHTHFDGLVLSHHYGHVPKRYADTLSMARALHPKTQRNDLASVSRYYNVENKLSMPEFKGKHLADIPKAERKLISDYNKRDVDVCYQIYKVMGKGFPESELDLIDITVRMFADPVLVVDMALAKKELRREQRDKARAIKESGVDADTLSSSPKFVKKLEELGVDIPMKPSPSNPSKLIPAVAKSDESLQALLLHPDQKVAKLVAARLAVKSTIGESRAERMLLRGKDGMNLPIYLNYYGAHTGRWSGGDKFNPQNFKQSKKVGGKLRQAIMAPPGHVMVVVDASQIEARVTAWLAEEQWILDAFAAKRDLYCEFASEAYHRTITKEDVQERFVGKTCVLGLGFGMGAPKLQGALLTQSINQGLDPVRLPLEICYALVTAYRMKCSNIKKEWDFLNDFGIGAMLSGVALDHMCVRFEKERCVLPNGLALLYPELRANVVQKTSKYFKGTPSSAVQDASYAVHAGRTKLYGGLLCENIVQALARIIVANVMRELAKKYRIVMMTHDEIVFIVKKELAQQAFAEASHLMAQPPSWAPDLPLSSDGGFDVCYSK